PTSCPVSQRKQRFAPQLFLLIHQRPQDKTLIWGKDTGSKLLLRFDNHRPRWIPFEHLLLFNKPLAKPPYHGFHPTAVADTVSLILESRQIDFDNGRRQLRWSKTFPMPRTFGNPEEEVP